MGRAPGEFELIAAIRERIERAGAPASPRLAVGAGDDAAVVAPEGAVVTSVDAAVDGVHFDLDLFGPQAVGHKALAAALSDLAAMGAEAGEAYVQLLLPDGFELEACLELAAGLAGVAAAHGVAVAGGDVSRAPALALALTVTGHLPSPGRAVTRAGARPGEVLAVTGELGGAAAGLRLLGDPALGEDLDPGTGARLRDRQCRPQPLLRAGRLLAGCGASAMIDLSDGLGGDAGHLARASDVALTVELERLPVQAGVAAVAARAGLDVLELAAAGGEDYELLATLPGERLDEARTALRAAGVSLTRIGAVGPGAGVRLIDPAGRERQPAGYDQLAARRAPSDSA